jgi:hypothetical protein
MSFRTTVVTSTPRSKTEELLMTKLKLNYLRSSQRVRQRWFYTETRELQVNLEHTEQALERLRNKYELQPENHQLGNLIEQLELVKCLCEEGVLNYRLELKRETRRAQREIRGVQRGLKCVLEENQGIVW